MLVRVSLNASKPLGEGLRVAMFAARADLYATADWVPRGIGPFDVGVITHAAPSSEVQCFAFCSPRKTIINAIRSRGASEMLIVEILA